MVIYQHQTGDTHLLDGFAKQFVAFCLSRGRFSISDAIEWVSHDCSSVDDSGTSIRSIINDLVQKHLIVAFS